MLSSLQSAIRGMLPQPWGLSRGFMKEVQNLSHQALQPPQATFNRCKPQFNGPGVSRISKEQSIWVSRLADHSLSYQQAFARSAGLAAGFRFHNVRQQTENMQLVWLVQAG